MTLARYIPMPPRFVATTEAELVNMYSRDARAASVMISLLGAIVSNDEIQDQLAQEGIPVLEHLQPGVPVDPVSKRTLTILANTVPVLYDIVNKEATNVLQQAKSTPIQPKTQLLSVQKAVLLLYCTRCIINRSIEEVCVIRNLGDVASYLLSLSTPGDIVHYSETLRSTYSPFSPTDSLSNPSLFSRLLTLLYLPKDPVKSNPELLPYATHTLSRSIGSLLSCLTTEEISKPIPPDLWYALSP